MFVRLSRAVFDEAGDDGDSAGGGDNSGGGEDVSALKEQMAGVIAENERLTAKITAANKHQKESEKAARDSARKEAEANGNYEQLFKSSEQDREALTLQLTELRQSNEAKEVNNASMKIAAGLAEGPNIEILSDYLSRRLKFTEEGIKVTDETGNLTVSTLDDLSKEFSGSARFASLIKGNQSSGGGAAGGSNSGSAAKEMNRADFDGLDPVAKMKFIKDGGITTDN